MAILIVEHKGTVEGASLSGRILIGRRGSNHVVVDDPAVSRIHAWIDTAGHQFCLTDAGSRSGTFVNGQRVASKRALRDGDRITVGPATLIFRADGSLPAGVSQLNFSDRADAQADGGILFDCTCGAPLWISSSYAGRMGKCRFCGAVLQVPHRSGAAAVVKAAATAVAVGSAAGSSSLAAPHPIETTTTIAPAQACGICQSPIVVGDMSTSCPDCGLTFHADCWTENFGCAAYGCSQVNVLLPPEPTVESSVALDTPPSPAPAAADVPYGSRIPTEYALLAGSVAGLLFGTLTFGIPAALALIPPLIHLRRNRGQPLNRVVVAAALLALVGIPLGIVASYFWWLIDNRPPAGIGVWSEQGS